MTIENIQPASIDTAPAEENHKAVPQGKKSLHERKLKRAFKKKLKVAKAAGKKAKDTAKRARRAQRKAECERDAAVAEVAPLKKRIASKDQDVTDALRDSDGFIYLKERVERNV